MTYFFVSLLYRNGNHDDHHDLISSRRLHSHEIFHFNVAMCYNFVLLFFYIYCNLSLFTRRCLTTTLYIAFTPFWCKLLVVCLCMSGYCGIFSLDDPSFIFFCLDALKSCLEDFLSSCCHPF